MQRYIVLWTTCVNAEHTCYYMHIIVFHCDFSCRLQILLVRLKLGVWCTTSQLDSTVKLLFTISVCTWSKTTWSLWPICTVWWFCTEKSLWWATTHLPNVTSDRQILHTQSHLHVHVPGVWDHSSLLRLFRKWLPIRIRGKGKCWLCIGMS